MRITQKGRRPRIIRIEDGYGEVHSNIKCDWNIFDSVRKDTKYSCIQCIKRLQKEEPGFYLATNNLLHLTNFSL